MIVQGEPLRRFADVILQGMGAPPDVAAEVATHLVRANLSGHDAHGVCRLPEYAALAEAGELRPAARPAIVRETAVAALFDARHGFGQHAAAVALDWCLARAHGAGVAVAAVRRSGDVGRLAEYAERAAEAGVLAIVTAGSAGPDAGETMLHGGRTRFLGANSWAFAAPGRRRWLAFEGSTSTVAAGEVLLARAKGEPLPPDCLYDRFGRPSTDPADLEEGGGLAGGDEEAAGIGGVFLEVVDPAAFGDTDAYQARVERTLVAAKSVRPVAGRSEVLLPGEPEARSRTDRGRTGVRLPETTWADLGALAARFGVEVPA